MECLKLPGPMYCDEAPRERILYQLLVHNIFVRTHPDGSPVETRFKEIYLKGY